MDTNGSFPMLIEKLIQTNLVDLFGISLKGLSAAEAVKRSGTRNEESCWGNVLKSISMTNIFFSGSEIGVLDFDQSGDCCLVSDLILQSATWIELMRQK